MKNLVDSILDFIRDRRSSHLDARADISRRARRFMFKIISRIPIIPPTLIVTGVTIPAERNHIGSGGFGRVFKGELRREVVALKVLCKCDNQLVRPFMLLSRRDS